MAVDTVDLLIIGAGASGVAMAWSLADTRMRILCLEQGDWPNPADYPVNDDESPIKVANFNGVGTPPGFC